MAARKIDEGVLARARELLGEGESQRSVSKQLGVSQSGLCEALKRSAESDGADLEPTVEVSGDEGHFYTDETTPEGARALMAKHGFDPADWEVVKASMTYWGWNSETGAPFERLKVDVRRRLSLLGLLPASHGAVPAVPAASARVGGPGPQTGVIFADQHAPYHDADMHACALAFLRDVGPDFGLLLGDTLDLPRPSRHRRNPRFDASPQESVDSAYRLVRDYVEAAPVRWLKLLGNHDVRLRNYLLESSAPELATLRPAATGSDEDVTPALAVKRLLHLDALGVECVEPEGEYGDELIYVSDKLAFIHGEKTGRNPGASELRAYGHSIGFGHTHRKSTTYRTTWDGPEAAAEVGPFLAGAASSRPRPQATTHLAFEVGCMARVEGGLGYTRRPDWQNGFGFVTVWPDGRFNLEHAVYTAGELFFRGERWTA